MTYAQEKNTYSVSFFSGSRWCMWVYPTYASIRKIQKTVEKSKNGLCSKGDTKISITYRMISSGCVRMSQVLKRTYRPKYKPIAVRKVIMGTKLTYRFFRYTSETLRNHAIIPTHANPNNIIASYHRILRGPTSARWMKSVIMYGAFGRNAIHKINHSVVTYFPPIPL